MVTIRIIAAHHHGAVGANEVAMVIVRTVVLYRYCTIIP
jgi:hypothetical protein